MKTLFLATAAILALSGAPASAQILGGGGLGGGLRGGGSLGGLGGTIGGGGSGTLGGTIERVREPVTTTTRTTTRADGNAKAKSHVDRRSGRVNAGGAAGTHGSTTLDNESGPLSLGGSAAGSGSASGNATADLVGTDDVRGASGSASGTLRGAANTTRGLAGRARDHATNTVGTLGNGAGSVAGNGSANGSADGTAGSGLLALSGSSAAHAVGSFDVAPGMDVTDVRGRTIGTVREVIADARGRVQAVRMEVGKRLAIIPAGNFSGSGDVLVSAATAGEIKDMAEDQSGD